MKFTLQPNKIDVGLCSDCKNATVYVPKRGNPTVHCTAMRAKYIPGGVTDCNVYTEKGVMEMWEMRELAWVLETTKRGKLIGFKPPSKDDD